MATSSPFVLANSSSENSRGNSSRGEEGKKETISRKHDDDSGKRSTKGKLFSAPVSSLRRSKSDDPLVYHENSAEFIIDDIEISKCISFRSLDERTLKFDFRLDDSEDEEKEK
ncbi:Uncharacterized protein Adt_11056 [Abeliophyllum distichum]|uniref:Uncharacterized protein n=1 Tax=Abeliophyllum distichum TaxID=126358 RepID=A0ABD1ULR8_9LAMI